MRTILTYLLLAVALPLIAQQKNEEASPAKESKTVVATESLERDTTRLLQGIAIHANLSDAAMAMWGSKGAYEAGLRVNLKGRWFPVIELGYGRADTEDIMTTMCYRTKAPYGRIGMDFNLLRNKFDDYKLFGGFRYAYTSFDYDVYSNDADNPDAIKAFGQHGQYHWIEGIFGADAMIWGPLHLGWDVRYRKRISGKLGETGPVEYVPGFGAAGGTKITANFNIIISI